MALLLSTLKDGIKRVLDRKPRTTAQAASGFADAYNTYAQVAMAGAAIPTFTGLEKAAFQSTLLAGINSNTGNPALIAQAWADAVNAFWLLPPVPFTDGVNAGVPTAFPGLAILGPCLIGIFSNVNNTEETAAAGMASCLDTATRTITVFLVPSMATFPLT